MSNVRAKARTIWENEEEDHCMVVVDSNSSACLRIINKEDGVRTADADIWLSPQQSYELGMALLNAAGEGIRAGESWSDEQHWNTERVEAWQYVQSVKDLRAKEAQD